MNICSRMKFIYLACFIVTLTACSANTPQMATTPKPAEATVTFHEDLTCSYEGPDEFPYGEFIINWNINDQSRDQYALVVFTMQKDKTLNDVIAWDASGAPLPEWLRTIAVDEFGQPGSKSQMKRDLRQNAGFKEGPLYIACYFEEGLNHGILGPIAVIK